MKILLFFALASVGICWDGGSYDSPPPMECDPCEPYVPTFDRCDDYINKYADDDNCLQHALESVPQLLEIGKKLICKHRRNELDKRFQYYAEFQKELRDFLGCTGCFVGEAVGLEETLGHLGAAVGNITGIAVEIVGEIILTGEFPSTCVERLSNSDLKQKTGGLRNISCMAKRGALDIPLTVEILKSVGCSLDSLVGLGNSLENLTEDLGKTLDSLLRNVLDAVLGIPAVGKLVQGITCTALGLVGGLLDVVLDILGK